MTPKRPLARQTARTALLAMLLFTAACNGDADEHAWNFERMLTQPRGDAYEATTFFANGAVMQSPPAGTVPRKRLLGPAAVVDGRDATGWVARIPLSVDRAALDQGHARFDVYCSPCHGVLGDGDTPVADSMSLRRPPNLHSAAVRDLAPGRVYGIVRDGYGLMPAYGDVLSVDERWAVVAYLQALHLSQNGVLAAVPSALRAELAARANAAAAGPEVKP